MQYVYGYVCLPLNVVAQYSKTRVSATVLTAENYVSVENLLQNKCGKTDYSGKLPEGNVIAYKENDTLIGNIRPYLKKVWFADRNGGTNGDVLPITIKDEYALLVNPKYLYYCLSSNDFFDYDMSFAKGAKMPRGDKDAVMSYLIYLPSFEEQEKIVSILDRFDKLCNDIEDGLPAEIEVRQKQYEFYRDKLLTFAEKK